MSTIKIRKEPGSNEWEEVAAVFVLPYDDTQLKSDINLFKTEVTSSNNLFKQDINNLIGTISTALDELNGEVI